MTVGMKDNADSAGRSLPMTDVDLAAKEISAKVKGAG